MKITATILKTSVIALMSCTSWEITTCPIFRCWMKPTSMIVVLVDGMPPVILLVSSMLISNCTQINSIKNCNNVLLDLVFTNNSNFTKVNCANDMLLPCDKHHQAFVVSIQNISSYKPLQFEEQI
ncbi:unnamed protein product [Acanthoscelides obtectus]|uniref:Uncharacterized protein n=1 Tax=Acanthoscelides obtectus TaxID=200917 RepID=A0A9P0LVS1_ACAOB|nr:unnamed protein product [Acanthoscelides obtectus]CAK1658848.1 hypothetical protein AOBTE_LOCUS21160 [Acanthoscelides obtectus]